MMSGKNRAQLMKSAFLLKEAEARKNLRPCIFLSHISIDKTTAINIGNYIMEKGDIDIYLDIYDEDLQQAVTAGDPYKITLYLEEGLEQSTHIMCLVSQSTIKSWWVPYELGYGKRAKKDLATLTLKNTVELPSYLKIGAILRGTKSLNDYLSRVGAAGLKGILGESYHSSLIRHSASPHPLDNCLDWNQ
jgi:TIR domain